MKCKILIIAVLMPLLSLSQGLEFDEAEFTAKYIGQLDGVEPEVAYQRARVHVIKAFKDAKEVVQLDDKEAQHLFARGTFLVDWTVFLTSSDMYTWFDLDFEIKDDRYRILVNNLQFRWTVPGYPLNKQSVKDFCEMRSGKAGQRTCNSVKREVGNIVNQMIKAVHDKKNDDSSDW